jgi:hypothetical protein
MDVRTQYHTSLSMYTYRTLPWSDVMSFYHDLVQIHHWPLQPMLDLVTFIATSSYAQGLFPVTSHATLRLGHYPDFLPGDGELVIDFDGPTQTFCFEYWSSPMAIKRWIRHYPAQAGQHRLEYFLQKQVRWFRA